MYRPIKSPKRETARSNVRKVAFLSVGCGKMMSVYFSCCVSVKYDWEAVIAAERRSAISDEIIMLFVMLFKL